MSTPRLPLLLCSIFGHLGLFSACMSMVTSGAYLGFARDITPESGERYQVFELTPNGNPDSR